MSASTGDPTFQREYASALAARLVEPRRFLQVVAGPRQVGKTTLVHQVLADSERLQIFVTADEPALRDAAWLTAQWERARLLATLLVGGDGIPVEEFLSRPVTDWL